MQDIHAQRILILDFGSQYTQLIARRVREIGVYSEIRAFDITEEEIREYRPNGIILAGGPESVTELDSPRAPACRRFHSVMKRRHVTLLPNVVPRAPGVSCP